MNCFIFHVKDSLKDFYYVCIVGESKVSSLWIQRPSQQLRGHSTCRYHTVIIKSFIRHNSDISFVQNHLHLSTAFSAISQRRRLSGNPAAKLHQQPLRPCLPQLPSVPHIYPHLSSTARIAPLHSRGPNQQAKYGEVYSLLSDNIPKKNKQM